jgi:antirestriction protein
MAKSAQASSSAAKRVPRIYVASLSDYNAGRLHGVWLEATDIQDARAGVAAMLKASPGGNAEEYAIHDFEGFSRYLPSESADLELVCTIGAAIVDHGRVFTAYLEHVAFPTETNSVAKLVAGFTESYQGAYESLEDWAEQYLEETAFFSKCPSRSAAMSTSRVGPTMPSSTETSSRWSSRGRCTSSQTADVERPVNLEDDQAGVRALFRARGRARLGPARSASWSRPASNGPAGLRRRRSQRPRGSSLRRCRAC